MYDELNLLFLETEPVRAVERLGELDLLKFIHPRLTITRTFEETFMAIQETFAWFKLLFFEEDVNKSHLFLMALIEELTPRERNEALKRLHVPPRASRELLDGIRGSYDALARLQGPSEKEIYYALRPLSIQTILFAMAKARSKEQKKAISLYLTSLRKIKPELTGEDLRAMGYSPGPFFKRVFNAVLDAKLEGRIKNRQEELEFVKEEFGKENIKT
jgi:tRNA nucleotidyltransferase (CCA-adding enzyme)